jgi:hypothetical protein
MVEMLPHRAIDGQGDNAVHERVEHPAEFRRSFPFDAKGDEEGRELDGSWASSMTSVIAQRVSFAVRSSRARSAASRRGQVRWPVSGRHRRRGRARRHLAPGAS